MSTPSWNPERAWPRRGVVAALAIQVVSWMLCSAAIWFVCLGVRALRLRRERAA